MIVQSTGEDWIDTKISLSTAVPSVGGNVPELETVNVKIREPIVYEHRAKYLYTINNRYSLFLCLFYTNFIRRQFYFSSHFIY